MSRFRTRLLLIALLLSALLACGQKGPLYLPDDPERPKEETPRLQP